jgi:hypothetical protein
MAPKNIVLPGRGAGPRGDAGADTPATAATGLPQLPQKRWPGIISAPQYSQLRAAVLAGEACTAAKAPVARPTGLAGCVRATPSEAPHIWQTVALMGDSASQASQTSPSVI